MRTYLAFLLIASTLFLGGCTSCDDSCESRRLEIMKQQNIEKAKANKIDIEYKKSLAEIPVNDYNEQTKSLQSMASSTKYVENSQKVRDVISIIGILGALSSE